MDLKDTDKKVAIGLAITVLAGLGAGVVAWGLPGDFDRALVAIGTAELVVAWLLYKGWSKLD